MLRVAVTFDDGYLEHFESAQLLSRLGVKATFFIITGLQSWMNKPLLTTRPTLVKQMSLMGHEIASHTRTHPNLTRVSREEIDEELSGSKQWLEETIGSEVEGFAFPYGAYDALSKAEAMKFFSYARTARVSSEDITDPYEISVRPFRRNLMSGLAKGKISRGRKNVVILVHLMSNKSLLLWALYFKSLNVKFSTLSDMVKHF